MQRAAPMWEAAGFWGMSEKTLRDTYGHHHPDHLRGAANAIGSRSALPKKEKLVISFVEETAERTQAAQPFEIIGGAGRTRTCNQTVMSAALWREIRTKSAFLDQDHPPLCAFVHGVSAG